jgi:hypothetical protein
MGAGVLGAMTPNYVDKAQGYMNTALRAEQSRMKKRPSEDQEKSIGGGLMAAAGGAAGGAMVGGYPGAIIGGVVGLAGYALS